MPPDCSYTYTSKLEVFEEYETKKEYDAGVGKAPNKHHEQEYVDDEDGKTKTRHYTDVTLTVVDYNVMDNQTQKTVDQGVYLTTDSDTDTDGMPKAKDPTHSSETSFSYKEGKSTKYIDAGTVPYTTAAFDFMTDHKLELGNYAVVEFNGSPQFAILADRSAVKGSTVKKTGENAYIINKNWGQVGGIDESVVLTVYFPNTGIRNGINPLPINKTAIEAHWLNFQRAKYNIDGGKTTNTEAPKP